MSQKHIRKLAGFGWVKRAWLRLHEPRIISALYGAAYTIAAVLGGVSVFHPPRTIEHVAGDTLMSLIAGATALGGVLGVVTVSMGVYWVERYAVGVTLIGLGGYWAMVFYLAVTTGGNRWMQVMALSLAFLFIVTRLYWVNDRPYNPRRRLRRRTDTGA